MRRIYTKNGVPKSFRVWKKANNEKVQEWINDDNCTGDKIWEFFRKSTLEYKELKKTLVEDQGFICCYCGQRIENNHKTSIEHLNPKSEYKNFTLNFNNLLASCNGSIRHIVKKDESLADIANKYGVDIEYLLEVYVHVDEIKLFGKLYDLENLSEGDKVVIVPDLKAHQYCDTKKNKKEIDIHPLQDDCTKHFSYNFITGKINLNQKNSSTVNILGLNDSAYINQLRKNTLNDAVGLMNLLMESPTNLKETVRKIVDNLNTITESNPKLESFVFVKIWSLQN